MNDLCVILPSGSTPTGRTYSDAPPPGSKSKPRSVIGLVGDLHARPAKLRGKARQHVSGDDQQRREQNYSVGRVGHDLEVVSRNAPKSLCDRVP
jgi:hypothetical protein